MFLGQNFVDAGVIHHVTHSEPFSDHYYFYRFQEDNETNVLNMKRIWVPAVPARPAPEVMQQLLTKLACLREDYRLRIITTKHHNSAGISPNLVDPTSIPRNATCITKDYKAKSETLPGSSSAADLKGRVSYGMLPTAALASMILTTI